MSSRSTGRTRQLRLACYLAVTLVPCGAWGETTIDVRPDGDNVTVRVDGELFTRYVSLSHSRPILFPIIGPSGRPMTRSYPMQTDVEGEVADHPHHRSLWFGHGDVNGVDFWSEHKASGTIHHVEFLKVESQPEPVIITHNEWLTADGKKLLTDFREIRFGADADRRWIDFDVTLVNDTEQAVKLGDTKEGTFGIRVAAALAVDAGHGGEIVNSLGARDGSTWGKPASWVDYHGPMDKQYVGIAVLNHPSSFRFPTYWHVRTYGLLAANVFGLHNFKNSNEEDGSHVLEPGDRLPFYYRVLLHRGDEQQGRIPEEFAEYVKVDKPIDGIAPMRISQIPLVDQVDAEIAP